MTDAELLQSMGTDARKWAHEFNRIAQDLGTPEMDEGWLIGWFANAIEAGREAGRHEYTAEITLLRKQADALLAENRRLRAPSNMVPIR